METIVNLVERLMLFLYLPFYGTFILIMSYYAHDLEWVAWVFRILSGVAIGAPIGIAFVRWRTLTSDVRARRRSLSL